MHELDKTGSVVMYTLHIGLDSKQVGRTYSQLGLFALYDKLLPTAC